LRPRLSDCFFFLLGICWAWPGDAFGFRGRSAAEKILFSAAYSTAATPVLAVLLTRYLSYKGSLAIFLLMSAVALFMRGKFSLGGLRSAGRSTWLWNGIPVHVQFRAGRVFYATPVVASASFIERLPNSVASRGRRTNRFQNWGRSPDAGDIVALGFDSQVGYEQAKAGAGADRYTIQPSQRLAVVCRRGQLRRPDFIRPAPPALSSMNVRRWRCTPNFRATARIAPAPCSYSRRICSSCGRQFQTIARSSMIRARRVAGTLMLFAMAFTCDCYR
jgi:hypothetical protein